MIMSVRGEVTIMRDWTRVIRTAGDDEISLQISIEEEKTLTRTADDLITIAEDAALLGDDLALILDIGASLASKEESEVNVSDASVEVRDSHLEILGPKREGEDIVQEVLFRSYLGKGRKAAQTLLSLAEAFALIAGDLAEEASDILREENPDE